jgi:hypothetical protein
MYLRSSRKKLLNVPFWQYKGGGVLVKKNGGVLVKKSGGILLLVGDVLVVGAF